MREIKFRGKCNEKNSKKFGQWIYGGVCEYEGIVTVIFEYEPHYIDYEVDPKTVGQYTGLKDKNGVEIYEGDIVKTKYHELRDFGDEIEDYYTEFVEEVTWLPVYNGFGLKIMIEDIPLYRPLDFVREVSGIKLIELEVIGNIYDNPELLKEVEE